MLRWQDTHFSERRREFLVSYIPSFTDCSWVQPFSACASSHFSAGPWQASQNTPSVLSNFGPRTAAGTFTAWHIRQRSLASPLVGFCSRGNLDWPTPGFSFSLVSAP